MKHENNLKPSEQGKYTLFMKQLTEYKRNGLTWQILTRLGNAAIFQSRYGYEVIVIQSHNGRTIAGNYCEPAEYPPSNEQWGGKGWSYRIDQLWQAEIKLADLAHRRGNNLRTHRK